MTYRAYIRVTKGDEGTPLGHRGLLPLCDNLNAHIREAEEQGWRIGYSACRVQTHLGKPVIVMAVDEAWQVRLAYRVIRGFLERTGWSYRFDLNANTWRAL